jgi:hypothetical protein
MTNAHEGSDMAESDRLVQRFVDQELSAEERVRFVVRLGRDEALRQRAIALERLVLSASRLPRPAVPAGFVSGVLERTAPAEPVWRRLVGALLAPRALQWNLAGAAGVAALGLLVAVGIVAGRRSVGPGQPESAPAGNTAGSTVAPAAPAVLVRLVVLQPDARTVQVAGDFNAWNPARTPLEPRPGGAWTVTLPLKPGRYEYMFVVDGREWIADPLAAELNDDGFGSRNAVLDVRPPETLEPGGPAGAAL